ncbi:hypothetical protein FAZ69_07505 [Trinickia terrae]|uniref:YXWGXW repeat-containing protein n=1 Tax=Trinickia terrae TaxID=2571161 RepID=A0A4V5PJG1_9BURK|nr:hypothetical protein FAZ69_07505 [Trinickia terrae]
MLLRATAVAIVCAAVLPGCVVPPAHPPQPAPVAEVRPPPPASGYHWVHGRYVWADGRWVWVRGYWVQD